MSLVGFGHAVDGRNPAPAGMYKARVNNGTNYLPAGAGFLPSTVFVRCILSM